MEGRSKKEEEQGGGVADRRRVDELEAAKNLVNEISHLDRHMSAGTIGKENETEKVKKCGRWNGKDDYMIVGQLLR